MIEIHQNIVNRKITEIIETGEDILMLSGYPLENIPDKLFEAEHLTELYLDDCRLDEIPNELFKLKKLKKLNLSKNNIKLIPEGIKKLKELEHLDLQFNKITSFDSPLYDLKSLKKLIISHNRFSQLPIGITSLKSLEYLDIGFNLFTTIPSQVFNLNNSIQYLDISFRKNNSEYIDLSLFSKFDKLIEFGAYNLDFKDIPDEIVGGSSMKLVRYIKTLKQSGIKLHFEAKLILVGKGGVGKTTLRHRLFMIRKERKPKAQKE